MNLRTAAATKVLGGLSLLVILALGWLLLLGPSTTALSDVRLEIADTRDQNDVLRLQLASLRKQQQQLDETRAAADALAAMFPPTADQPGLFREITAAAQDAGIREKDVTSLTPTPPVVGEVDPATGVQLQDGATGADLAQQTVSIAVEGSYDQTQRLLENLEQMSRAYLVTSVALSGGSTSGTFTTTVTGDMFVMQPVQDPAQAAVSAPAEDE
jgi:Tfp pilus assembly protein PilO